MTEDTITLRQGANGRTQIAYALPNAQRISIIVQKEGDKYELYVNWDHVQQVGSFRDSYTHLFHASLDPETCETGPTFLDKRGRIC